MAENQLKHIDGKKIRRQYFTAPPVFLCILMLMIPYTIFVISLGMGKFDPSAWPSTLWVSVLVCFGFSLPFLVLRALNKHCFGRIICVLSAEGIHYPKGMLRWETVEKIEYALDAKPRYKNDPAKAYRAILYTRGGKHVILPDAPLYLVPCVKKCRRDPDVKITGAASLLSTVGVMAAIFLLLPLYVVLLLRSPGASGAQILVMAVIFLAVGLIRTPVFDAYAIPYRFWRGILPRKWLSCLILLGYYLSFFAATLVLFYFPNWVVTALVGIYLGVVQPPMPTRHGHRRHIPSYDRLCDLYIRNAEVWEKKIAKSRVAKQKE